MLRVTEQKHIMKRNTAQHGVFSMVTSLSKCQIKLAFLASYNTAQNRLLRIDTRRIEGRRTK